MYSRELLISNKGNGYRDIVASIDLSTYRRIPWENNVPFFLVSFFDPDTKDPLSVDPRGTLKLATERAGKIGRDCYAGVEYEVQVQIHLNEYISSHTLISTSTSKVWSVIQHPNIFLSTFSETPQSVADKNFTGLQPMTPGSSSRPIIVLHIKILMIFSARVFAATHAAKQRLLPGSL